MNHNRQLGRARQFHLLQKDALLHLARRMIVEIIQPDFTPRNYLRPFGQLFEFDEIRLGSQLRLMRMNADSRVNKIAPLGDPNSAIERPRPSSAADRDNALDPSLPRARQHRVAVSVEFLAIKMCVRIYEHSSR